MEKLPVKKEGESTNNSISDDLLKIAKRRILAARNQEKDKTLRDKQVTDAEIADYAKRMILVTPDVFAHLVPAMREYIRNDLIKNDSKLKKEDLTNEYIDSILRQHNMKHWVDKVKKESDLNAKTTPTTTTTGDEMKPELVVEEITEEKEDSKISIQNALKPTQEALEMAQSFVLSICHNPSCKGVVDIPHPCADCHGSVWYCSVDCQRKDTDRHHLSCMDPDKVIMRVVAGRNSIMKTINAMFADKRRNMFDMISKIKQYGIPMMILDIGKSQKDQDKTKLQSQSSKTLGIKEYDHESIQFAPFRDESNPMYKQVKYYADGIENFIVCVVKDSRSPELKPLVEFFTTRPEKKKRIPKEKPKKPVETKRDVK